MIKCFFCGSDDVVGINNTDDIGYAHAQVFVCKKHFSRSCVDTDKKIMDALQEKAD